MDIGTKQILENLFEAMPPFTWNIFAIIDCKYCDINVKMGNVLLTFQFSAIGSATALVFQALEVAVQETIVLQDFLDVDSVVLGGVLFIGLRGSSHHSHEHSEQSNKTDYLHYWLVTSDFLTKLRMITMALSRIFILARPREHCDESIVNPVLVGRGSLPRRPSLLAIYSSFLTPFCPC